MPRGKGANRQQLIAESKEVLAAIQPVSVRGVAYQLFNRKLTSDMGANEVKRVGNALIDAREHGIIPWAWIVDETREIEVSPTWPNLTAFFETVRQLYARDFWAEQPVRVTVGSEKGTVRGVVQPVLDAYRVPFIVFHGNASATWLHKLADYSRADERPFILLYLGDWDPAGMHMSDHDIPNRFARYGGQVEVRRVALVESDLADLPSFTIPLKPKPGHTKRDPRCHGYEQRYGTQAWELDALDPNTLRAHVEEAIRSLIDWPAWGRSQDLERRDRDRLARIMADI
jgi:hypothetical protein